MKHEDYNMMVSEMRHKCKLIPRSDLSHLETVCFDMSEKMLGPCRQDDISKLMKCSLTDVLNADDFLQPLSEKGRNFIKLLVETYFSEDVSTVLDDPPASYSKEPHVQEKNTMGLEGPSNRLEGKELFVGSSSWPWKQNPKKDLINLAKSCKCLQNQEIYQMTGIEVDFEPCTQPIPWCYVRNDANCYDQMLYNSFGAECPDCVLGKEDKEHSLSNNNAISWSTSACGREQIDETLKRPYFFK